MSYYKNEELIAAAIYGRVEEVKNLLLQGAANPNYENEHGYTALMWAAENGNVELVKVLLNAPDINVNHANRFGNTALMQAAKYGRVEVVKKLSANGANVNDADNNGETALIYVVKYSDVDQIKKYLSEGDDPNAMNKRVEIVKELLEKGADVNHADNDGDTALMWATENGNVEVKKYLENFVNVKTFIQRSINYNIRKINQEINEIIEDKTTDIDIKETKIIDFLKKEFCESIINNLKFENNSSLLHLAVLYDMKNLTEKLIEMGIDANDKDNANLTAWEYACFSLNADIAKTIKPSNQLTEEDKQFLEESVNLKAATNEEYFKTKDDNEKDGVINKVCVINREEILTYYGIIQKKQTNEQEKETKSVNLLAAAGNDYVEVVNSLLTANADVNRVNSDGDTALIVAARNYM